MSSVPQNLSTCTRVKSAAHSKAGRVRSLQGLQRESATSLYEQIADGLRQHVSSGQARAQVPTEEALTQMFGVSRSMVRKAVQRLVDLKIQLPRAEFLVSCRQPPREIGEALEISQSSRFHKAHFCSCSTASRATIPARRWR